MVALAVRDAAFINDVQCSLSYIRFWKIDQGKMSMSTALAAWISRSAGGMALNVEKRYLKVGKQFYHTFIKMLPQTHLALLKSEQDGSL